MFRARDRPRMVTRVGTVEESFTHREDGGDGTSGEATGRGRPLSSTEPFTVEMLFSLLTGFFRTFIHVYEIFHLVCSVSF